MSNLRHWGSTTNYSIFSNTDGTLTLNGGDVIVLSDTKKLITGAGSDMGVQYDGTKGIVDTSLVAASDLAITCGTAKTLVLTTPVYNDLQSALITGKVGGANIPTWATVVGNLSQYRFAVNDYIEVMSQELLHNWKEGTTIDFHLHWISNGLEAIDTAVKWEVEYSFANPNGTFSSSTTISHEETIPANTADKTHFLTNVGTYTPSSGVIGSYVISRIRRIAATGTAPNANPFAMALGIHYQIDTLGSRQEAIK